GIGSYARNIIEQLPAVLPSASYGYFLGNRWSDSLPDSPRESPAQGWSLRHMARQLPVAWSLWRGLRMAAWRGSLSAADRGSVC
ncbi:MAG: hypothetical protein J0626_02415, partial [Rhodospirillaceae bacterium]|nr:hypothetical protein [Rhodospirillaceae bacterium]